MSDVIPLYSTSASLRDGGIFTIEKAGAAAKSGHKHGPVSLCDLAKDEGMKRIHLVENNMVSFFMAHKNLKSAGCDLAFGLKVVVTEDIADKSEASFKTESKVIIFLKSDQGYRDLIQLYTKAATDGFYYIPRLDWKTLRARWSDHLILALPFYSSFIAKNTLTFAAISPDLPSEPVVLREVGQELPFDSLLDGAVNKYALTTSAKVQQVKSIYYRNRVDAKQFLVWRCILGRSTFDSPNMDHMCSNEFCLESYKELTTT